MLEKQIITLTTDFGLKDPFVGMMKGVILGINPNANIIDITHNVQRHNIFEASQVVAVSFKYFPPNTIHIAVVDPGVGGIRRPILLFTEDHYFIGPDNGIFSTIYEKSNPNYYKVLHLTSSHYFLPMSGSTFHGRDIFAPVAAWLSKGIDFYKFGELIDDYVKLTVSKPTLTDDNNIKTLAGEIISIDRFGNAISNITTDDLTKLTPIESVTNLKIIYKDMQLSMLNYYAEKGSTDLSAIINSFSHLELFIYKDSAAEKFNIKIGDRISITQK